MRKGNCRAALAGRGRRAGVATIRQTVGTLPGRIEIKRPKTATSRREINLPAHRSSPCCRPTGARRSGPRGGRAGAQGDPRPFDLVFPSAAGTPIHPDNLDRDFARLVRLASVKKIRIHDLRHSYATVALQLGNPLKAVSESMGHADVSTTLRTYIHVVPAQRAALADSVGATLFEDGSEP